MQTTACWVSMNCVLCLTAGDIVTQEQTSKVIRVVPERDGHRVELQWAVPPETEAYKVFPCSYLRSVPVHTHMPLVVSR